MWPLHLLRVRSDQSIGPIKMWHPISCPAPDIDFLRLVACFALQCGCMRMWTKVRIDDKSMSMSHTIHTGVSICNK